MGDVLIALDKKIAKEYHEAATHTPEYPCDYGEMRRLRLELQELCGITEVEALNVLTDHNVSLYISLYNYIDEKNYGGTRADLSQGMHYLEIQSLN